MKNFCVLLLVMLVLFSIVTSACSKKTKGNMIQAKRKFENYLEPKNTKSTYVDLSEGPKLNYDADLGPKNLNFDFKIVDPYK